MIDIHVKRLTSSAKLPTKNLTDDAGLDFFSDEEAVLKPGELACLKLGVAIDIPPGYCGLWFPRSGLSKKKGSVVLANVIDAGYRGEVHAVVINGGSEEWSIKVGDKVAQMVIVPIPGLNILEVAEFIGETERGEKGFGSSGV